MSKQITLAVRATTRWWWPLYKYGLVFMCWATGMRPDFDKVREWARRATKIHVEVIEVKECDGDGKG